MKILVVGGGGREHALVWKLAQSPGVKEILCAPGNAGIAQMASCFPVPVNDISSLIKLAKEKQVGLTLIGPELPLTLGIVDAFQAEGLSIIGPSRAASQIEASKIFAKDFMNRHQIPTAQARSFSTTDEAVHYIKELKDPPVIKADGIASGKGVVVARDEGEAIRTVESMIQDEVFGDSGKRILVEERLEGEEATLLVFTDGKTVCTMLPSQDHKQIMDDDLGPNTGGMGAYSPAPLITEALRDEILEEMVVPTVHGLQSEGIDYRGILYVGLMMTAAGPRVLEYNARFGDPEAQAILPALGTDLLEILEGIGRGELDQVKLRWNPTATVCVVMASEGYPISSGPSVPIEGIESLEAWENVFVFHAGTRSEQGRYVTAGGRILGVTAWAEAIPSARSKVYAAVSRIQFKGMQYRRDIGLKALKPRPN